MYRSQKLSLRYYTAAVTLFGVMILFGLLSALYYLYPALLFNIFNFNMSKILHIDTLVIWLLMGFLGAVYWYLPKELGREVEGMWLAELTFWVFCAVVAVVAVVFLLVQYGGANEFSMWFINQGRKYVEAPRWASIGIVAVMLVFAYNVIATCIKARKMTGIMWVLVLDLIPLVAVYLDAFPAVTNMSVDLYWWWWLVHMWVESTWEVLIGCVMALVLMDVMGTSRRIVETWLYIEVMLVLGAGILGREEREDQVHRLVVDGFELHRVLESHEDAVHPLQALEPRVRSGHAVADPGRAGHFALDERVEDLAGVPVQAACRDLGDHRQHLALAGGADPHRDRRTIEKITDIHLIPEPPKAQGAPGGGEAGVHKL